MINYIYVLNLISIRFNIDINDMKLKILHEKSNLLTTYIFVYKAKKYIPQNVINQLANITQIATSIKFDIDRSTKCKLL